MATTEASTCVECGARSKRGADRYCSFCGTELPREAPAVAAPSDTRAARFEAARRAPAYARALDYEPSTGHLVVRSVSGAVVFAVFTVVALTIGVKLGFSGSMFGGGVGLLAVIPLAIAAYGASLVVKAVARTSAIRTSPTERHVALVRDERVKVSSGGRNSRATTSYFVTLEYEDGRRKEHTVDARLASRVASGDVGVAFERGGYLVDFVELDA